MNHSILMYVTKQGTEQRNLAFRIRFYKDHARRVFLSHSENSIRGVNERFTLQTAPASLSAGILGFPLAHVAHWVFSISPAVC